MSGACEALVAGASAGVAPALRAVDCVAANMTGAAFSRLFGAQGALAPALTILLTLYIAFFALSLLTGRTTLGISALTPRMLTLGLVLTFATSWIAYQGVVWTLATAAPDQIAGVLMGTGGNAANGSATQIFADRIDIVFAAIAQVSEAANISEAATQGAQSGARSGAFSPANLMWLAALLLLLGTVGVLVTARIALAVLLAVGPVFVVLALFGGTRGLTAGWLRAVMMTASVPLFVVVGGGLTLEMAVPVVAALAGENGVNGRAAMALFLIAAVHVALMVMLIRVAGTMVSAWTVFGLGAAREQSSSAQHRDVPVASYAATTQGASAPEPAHAGRRVPAMVSPHIAAMPVAPGESPGGAPGADAGGRGRGTIVVHAPTTAAATLARQRGRGVGSRFRTAPTPSRLSISGR